jgi:hypothetical protein
VALVHHFAKRTWHEFQTLQPPSSATPIISRPKNGVEVVRLFSLYPRRLYLMVIWAIHNGIWQNKLPTEGGFARRMACSRPDNRGKLLRESLTSRSELSENCVARSPWSRW